MVKSNVSEGNSRGGLVSLVSDGYSGLKAKAGDVYEGVKGLGKKAVLYGAVVSSLYGGVQEAVAQDVYDNLENKVVATESVDSDSVPTEYVMRIVPMKGSPLYNKINSGKLREGELYHIDSFKDFVDPGYLHKTVKMANGDNLENRDSETGIDSVVNGRYLMGGFYNTIVGGQKGQFCGTYLENLFRDQEGGEGFMIGSSAGEEKISFDTFYVIHDTNNNGIGVFDTNTGTFIVDSQDVLWINDDNEGIQQLRWGLDGVRGTTIDNIPDHDPAWVGTVYYPHIITDSSEETPVKNWELYERAFLMGNDWMRNDAIGKPTDLNGDGLVNFDDFYDLS